MSFKMGLEVLYLLTHTGLCVLISWVSKSLIQLSMLEMNKVSKFPSSMSYPTNTCIHKYSILTSKVTGDLLRMSFT